MAGRRTRRTVHVLLREILLKPRNVAARTDENATGQFLAPRFFLPARRLGPHKPICAIPISSNGNSDGSGTGAVPCTLTSNMTVPMTSLAPPSDPPRIEKKLGLITPGAANALMSIVNMSKGPLLWDGSRLNGAFRKKSVSSRLSSGPVTENVSPFRKTVLLVLFVTVPTPSTELPAAPDMGVTEMSTPSARSAGAIINSAASAPTAVHRLFVMFFTP